MKNTATVTDWMAGNDFIAGKGVSLSVLGFCSFYDNFINLTDKDERIYTDTDDTNQMMIIRVILIGRSRP